MPEPTEAPEIKNKLQYLLSGDDGHEGPLTGVLGISFTGVLAGPTAANILEGQGANLIKIENPKFGGDSARGYGPFTVDGRSTYHLSLNCGTHSIDLDLGKPEDKAIMEQLLGKADFMLHNQRPGVMEKLGYGRERIAQDFPRLVNCQISGDGIGGDQKGAYNEVVIGETGLGSSFFGYTKDGVHMPLTNSLSVADLFSGLQAANAISGALFDRERREAKGLAGGAFLDCSMKRSTLSTVANMVAAASNSDPDAARNPREPSGSHSSIAPFANFRCLNADGGAEPPGYIIIAAGNDRQFNDLAKILGLNEADVTKPGKYSTNGERLKHNDELRADMEAKLIEKTAVEWLPLLEAKDVVVGIPKTMMELIADPEIRDKYFVPVLDAAGELICYAPKPGVHNLNYPEQRPHVTAPGSVGADREAVLAALADQNFVGHIHSPRDVQVLGAGTVDVAAAERLAAALGIKDLTADDVSALSPDLIRQMQEQIAEKRGMAV